MRKAEQLSRTLILGAACCALFACHQPIRKAADGYCQGPVQSDAEAYVIANMKSNLPAVETGRISIVRDFQSDSFRIARPSDGGLCGRDESFISALDMSQAFEKAANAAIAGKLHCEIEIPSKDGSEGMRWLEMATLSGIGPSSYGWMDGKLTLEYSDSCAVAESFAAEYRRSTK